MVLSSDINIDLDHPQYAEEATLASAMERWMEACHTDRKLHSPWPTKQQAFGHPCHLGGQCSAME
eukprot:4755097-Lingulodinium_polyedra.AAC.1